MYKPKKGFVLVHGIKMDYKYACSKKREVKEFIQETHCLGVYECIGKEHSEDYIELLYDSFSERDDAMEIAEKRFTEVEYNDPEIPSGEYERMMNGCSNEMFCS